MYKKEPRKLTRPISPKLETEKRVKLQNGLDFEMTVDSSAAADNGFKARPLKKKILEKASTLPIVEKKEQTEFEEFRLSMGNQNIGKKTLLEY